MPHFNFRKSDKMTDPIYIIFVVGIVLAFLAHFSRSHIFWIFSGVWFLGNSVALSFDQQGFVSPLFFAMCGVVMIFISIERFYNDFRLNRDKRESEYFEEKELKV